MRREVILGSLVAFIASFCTLVIELVAGRILAPYLGVSIYTWTSIIGVVLAGISVGAYLGGMLADRYPRPATLGWLLFFAGLTALSIPVMTDSVGYGPMFRSAPFGEEGYVVPLWFRVLATTAMIFFIPSLILGMISPVVVRLAVHDVENAGNTVGKIYAFSTLGSIIGTFATGFVLIPEFGTRTLLYGVAALLMLFAPIFGGLLSGRGPVRAVVVGVCLLGIGLTLAAIWSFREQISRPIQLAFNRDTGLPEFLTDPQVSHFKESEYYTIRVYDMDYHGDPGRTLVLDHLIHSFTNVADPFYLKYDYLRIYEELVAWHRSSRTDASEFFFVGGGGYTLPRYFDHAYPDAHIDVAEIDPAVSKVAFDQLGIKDTRIHTYNMDGRWFVMNKEAITHTDAKYDFIFGDAFNDLSIPYHLTTKEFNDQLKGLMKPDGLLMCLVIDNIAQGHFIPTYIKTLQATFGPSNVQLIVFTDLPVDKIPCHTAIIVASPSPLKLDEFSKYVERRLERQKGVCSAVGIIGGSGAGSDFGILGLMPSANPARNTSRVIPADVLQNWMATRKEKTKREPMILTDDHAPVDNLTAAMFEERFGFKKE